eukprot:scaffold84749_cov69-Phaeocystis_antarctica.AAC.6
MATINMLLCLAGRFRLRLGAEARRELQLGRGDRLLLCQLRRQGSRGAAHHEHATRGGLEERRGV